MNGLFFRHQIIEEVSKEATCSNECEIYAILVAVKVWRTHFQENNIQIYCDNKTSVDILRSGKSKCQFSQRVLREIRYWSAQGNFKIRGVHLPGVKNEIADALSRWHLDPKYKIKFEQLTKGVKAVRNEAENLKIMEFW